AVESLRRPAWSPAGRCRRPGGRSEVFPAGRPPFDFGWRIGAAPGWLPAVAGAGGATCRVGRVGRVAGWEVRRVSDGDLTGGGGGLVRAGEGSMTEQNGRAYGGYGRPSALESAFGRPPGVESSFAPGAPPVTPPAPPPPPPAPGLRRLFSRPSGVADSFDPPPGAIRDTTPPPESPWWKPDADRDPWRDARSPASLGGPPDFGDGGPAPVGAPEEPAGRRRWGLRNITLTAAVVLLVAGLLTGIAGGVVGYLAADRITPALLDPDATLSQVS